MSQHHPLAERLPFTFETSDLPVTANLREARAHEYIAHYLEGIERHLGQIAKTLEVIAAKQ